ncbi:MAG: methyltransferase domain-containing protein [Terriglobales bacterium]
MRQRLAREWLDEDAGPEAEIRASLADLAWIHRRLGGAVALERLLASWRERAGRALPRRLDILDVGAGAGAGTMAMLAWWRGQGHDARLVALDRRASHLAAGRPWPPDVELVAGDLFAPPFPPRSFDLVVCSLLLHHFHGPAAVEAVRRMTELSRSGVVVHDLERSWLGYWGFRLIAAMRLSRMTRHDGRLSFRQAYTAPELAALAARAGCGAFRVQAAGRFRLGLTIWRAGESNGA